MKEDRPRIDIERHRSAFTKLVALNANYFGTVPDFGLKPVLELSRVTTYEALRCVAYNPAHDLLTATVELRRPNGYHGGLCGGGSREHVRFYVDRGDGWQDAGAGSALVHDVAAGTDCAGDDTLPLQYAVSVVYDEDRRSCLQPQLPRVRAILSWEVAPPPGQPDWQPVWGDVHECAIQLRPRRLFLKDLLASVKVDLADLQVGLSPIADVPLGLSSKVMPVQSPSAAEVALRYVQPTEVQVEPHRFAFPAVQQLNAGPLAATEVLAEWESIGVSLADAITKLQDMSGDTSYEELECLALDNNRGALSATFAVKRPFGYNGTLCKPGSREYVAFWADWDDTCEWTYLGTAQVTVHDFTELPEGGLCYAATLPVDLAAVRRPCHDAGVSRVRAVLSWQTPPSTTDPDDVPYWGNVLDAHVQVTPGERVDPANPVARIAVLGGVETAMIGPDGLTVADAVLAETGGLLDAHHRQCPFAGLVTVRGYSYHGYTYRVQVRLPDGTWAPVTTPFRTINWLGVGTNRTPGPDGWTPYLPPHDNVTNTLAAWHTSGDEKWEVRLEIQGVAGVDTHTIQLHNTFVTPGSLELDVATGSCRQYFQTDPIHGTFTARDEYIGRWWFDVLPGGSGGVVTPAPGITSRTGAAWSLDASAMPPCGYVLQLSMVDRVVVNSTTVGRYAAVHEGFCIIA